MSSRHYPFLLLVLNSFLYKQPWLPQCPCEFNSKLEGLCVHVLCYVSETPQLESSKMVGSRTTVNLGNQFLSHNKNVIPVNHFCIFLDFSETEAYMHKLRKRKRLLWWWCGSTPHPSPQLCPFLRWDNSLWRGYDFVAYLSCIYRAECDGQAWSSQKPSLMCPR